VATLTTAASSTAAAAGISRAERVARAPARVRTTPWVNVICSFPPERVDEGANPRPYDIRGDCVPNVDIREPTWSADTGGCLAHLAGRSGGRAVEGAIKGPASAEAAPRRSRCRTRRRVTLPPRSGHQGPRPPCRNCASTWRSGRGPRLPWSRQVRTTFRGYASDSAFRNPPTRPFPLLTARRRVAVASPLGPPSRRRGGEGDLRNSHLCPVTVHGGGAPSGAPAYPCSPIRAPPGTPPGSPAADRCG
jgi:hypothetical protein